jgi:hypothetical protein
MRRAYIRSGVNAPVALELAHVGVRSRRLVPTVAIETAASAELPVRERLTKTDIRTWRQLFEPSPSELGDLLVFSRARATGSRARCWPAARSRYPS